MSKKYKIHNKNKKVLEEQDENIEKSSLNKNNKVDLKLKKKRKLDNISKELEKKSKRSCNFYKNVEKTQKNMFLSDENYSDSQEKNQILNTNKSLSESESETSSDDSSSSSQIFEDDFSNKNNIPKVLSIKNEKKTEDYQNDESRVIYLGRIPHGFYELEMKNYFKQFGAVTRIKLSRNRKTGKSKHYAFIEFESPDVAKIVAKTMNNYLLFGHILKCSVIPQDKVHESMFIGSNKRFKPIPWSKITKKRHEEPKTTQQWITLQKKKDNRLKKKILLLKKLGINYQYGKIKK
ncbi:hypothetical protein PORY_001307 [Pneumocystis oryctolagi]|uniref:Uncharacterized protein n=1 Tax=Pneumocystis oryctolagi TaxID=42067 RepID=A0ACB7CDI7_9ASCO|nr:hypothetical protein PORY_001307 [Pneumocystis oryctolagi]